MKVYRKLYDQGHQVLMMKPYEDTGRYNKILYFKDNPNLNTPKGIVFDDKASFYGYGFYKQSNINDNTKKIEPSFFPYDINLERLKNKSLYKSIRANDLIDWREKDFTYTHAGKTYTYVGDRDFLSEPDWEELFQHFDNKIEFIRNLKPSSIEQADKLLTYYHGNQLIHLPVYTLNPDVILRFVGKSSILFHVNNEVEYARLIFAAKVLTDKPLYIAPYIPKTPYEKDLYNWATKGGQVSFKDYLGINYNDDKFLNNPQRIMLKQDPKKITFAQCKEEYLTF